MKMTKEMWEDLDFNYDGESKSWWSPDTLLGFGGYVSLSTVVRALLREEKVRSERAGQGEIRAAIRRALGL